MLLAPGAGRYANCSAERPADSRPEVLLDPPEAVEQEVAAAHAWGYPTRPHGEPARGIGAAQGLVAG